MVQEGTEAAGYTCPDLQLVLLNILGIKMEVGNWALWAKPGMSVGQSRRIVNSTPAWDTQ